MDPPLTDIYLDALRRCDPAALFRRAAAGDAVARAPVLSVGKAAAASIRGLEAAGWRGEGLAAVPSGYEGTAPLPQGVRLVSGSHPRLDDRSFAAGQAVLRFVRSLDRPALVIVSGGASAAVEAPLEPWFSRHDLVAANDLLLRSGFPIDRINTVRKHLSALKGGRLGTLLPPGSRAWILSDVPAGRPELVGSGPATADPSTCADAAAVLESIDHPHARRLAAILRSGEVPETPKRLPVTTAVIADNATLIRAAAMAAEERGWRAVPIDEAIDDEVGRVAGKLTAILATLREGEIALAGGEPTVHVEGEGRGGRCSELALRVLVRAMEGGLPPFRALFGSSDGRDGTSDAAGYLVAWDGRPRTRREEIAAALSRSDTAGLARRVSEAIMMPPTGNNLRDIMMMARA